MSVICLGYYFSTVFFINNIIILVLLLAQLFLITTSPFLLNSIYKVLCLAGKGIQWPELYYGGGNYW